MFESVQNPGSHLGVLPTGQLTAPAQTTKDTDASHFKIFLLVSSLWLLSLLLMLYSNLSNVPEHSIIIIVAHVSLQGV